MSLFEEEHFLDRNEFSRMESIKIYSTRQRGCIERYGLEPWTLNLIHKRSHFATENIKNS